MKLNEEREGEKERGGGIPAMQAATERYSSVLGTDLAISEGVILERRNDHVHGFDDPQQGVVGVLWLVLELQDGPVKLVDDQNGLHPLGEGLSQHGAGLYADAFNAINDNQGTVGQPQSGSYYGIGKRLIPVFLLYLSFLIVVGFYQSVFQG